MDKIVIDFHLMEEARVLIETLEIVHRITTMNSNRPFVHL